MFRNLFPYSNFHDLNMDWIIKTIKTLWSKSVFTVNNTEPDANGNVNLPTVAGVSSVNGIGADGNGNVQVIGKSNFIYADIVPNTTHYTGTGTAYYNMGVVSIRAMGTILAGTGSDDTLFTIPPGTIPERLYTIYLWAVDDSTHLVYPLRIEQSTGEVKPYTVFNEDCNIKIYETYLTFPTVTVPIVAP